MSSKRLSEECDWQGLEKYVHDSLRNEPSGHDYSHIQRVKCAATKITKYYQFLEGDVLLAAVLLHDISAKDGFVAKTHHIQSAGMAYKILQAFDFPIGKIEVVQTAIFNHYDNPWPYKRNQQIALEAGLALEDQILMDADRLDALGPIGIVRMAAFSNNLGVPYIISEEDGNRESYFGNFKYYAEADHQMWTPEGKKMMEERAASFKRIAEEIMLDIKSSS